MVRYRIRQKLSPIQAAFADQEDYNKKFIILPSLRSFLFLLPSVVTPLHPDTKYSFTELRVGTIHPHADPSQSNTNE
jgi:hypothetical protein